MLKPAYTKAVSIPRYERRKNRTGVNPVSSAEKIKHIVNNSGMKISVRYQGKEFDAMHISIDGPASKLPSTTNNRMITIERRGLAKSIRRMILDPKLRTSAGLKLILDAVLGLRPRILKNPDHLVQLKALSELLFKIQFVEQFKLNKDRRALVLIQLGSLNNRMDSHNLPKAFLDWLQECKIISNDRFCDAFAIRKSDHGIANPNTTEILIQTYRDAVDCRLNNLFCDFESARNYERREERKRI